MGFSQVAVFAFIITAVVAMAHLAVGSTLNASQKIDEAHRDDDRRDRLERGLACTVLLPVYDSDLQTVTVSISNDAPLTYDAALVDILLDGDYETDKITSRSVDGVTSNVWGPETTLVLVLGTQAGLPGSVAIIPEAGVCGYWRA